MHIYLTTRGRKLLVWCARRQRRNKLSSLPWFLFLSFLLGGLTMHLGSALVIWTLLIGAMNTGLHVYNTRYWTRRALTFLQKNAPRDFQRQLRTALWGEFAFRGVLYGCLVVFAVPMVLIVRIGW